jgi:membrane associated rhomboid family serine protease
MGSLGFLILYMAAGVFGYAISIPSSIALTHYSNILGANFSVIISPSVGASGAIFGTAAVGTDMHALDPVLTVFRSLGLISLLTGL